MAFASTMSPFLTRLFRPFSTASPQLSLQPSESLAARNYPPNAQRATVAAGCFWGVEHIYRKHFDGKGLLDARVGYTGGKETGRAPSYSAVCTGKTGHAESLLVVFDPDKVSYRELIEFFFRMHDPTTKDRQGNDYGTQYRSAIFANDDEQLEIANEIREKAGKAWFPGQTISTEITKAGTWYDAEEDHQEYLTKNPWGYQCAAHFVRKGKPLEE